MRRKSSNNRDNDKTAVDCDALSTATLSTKVVLSIYFIFFHIAITFNCVGHFYGKSMDAHLSNQLWSVNKILLRCQNIMI